MSLYQSSKDNMNKNTQNQFLQKTVCKPRSENTKKNLGNSSHNIERQNIKRFSKITKDITTTLLWYSDDFINEKFVKTNHLINFITSIRDSNIQEIQNWIKRYGMRDQYEKYLNAFIQFIRQLSKQPNYNWQIFYQAVLKRHGEIIQNPKILRQFSIKQKIFLIKNKECDLFDVISNFGIDHKYSKQVIQASTYEEFREDLFNLCLKIKSKAQTNRIMQSNPQKYQTLIIESSLLLNISQIQRELKKKEQKMAASRNQQIQRKSSQQKLLYQQIYQQQDKSQQQKKVEKMQKQPNIQQKIQQNPFIHKRPLEQSMNCQKVTFLFIFVSKDSIQNIIVFDQKMKNKQNTLQITQKQGSHLNLYYKIATFQANRKCNYKMQLIFSFRKRKQIKLNIKHMNNLLIMIDKQLEDLTNVDAAINKSLFQSIYFIQEHVIKKKKIKEEQIYAWLRLFYYSYKKLDRNEEIISKIFEDFTKIPLSASQHLLCFFHSIYRQESAKYYLKSSLRSYLKFPKQIFQFNFPNYSYCQQFNLFYMQIHLFNLIEHNDIVKHHELIKNLFKLNIKHQSQERIIQILENGAIKVPHILMELSIQLKNLLKQKNICAHDYFKIKLPYIKYQINKDSSIQQRIILDLMTDLIELSQKCKGNCKQRLRIKHEEIQNLLIESKLFKGKSIRISEKYLPQLYAKSKNLKLVSNNHFNFTKIAGEHFYQKIDKLLEKYPLQALSCALTKPSQKDGQILNLFLKKDALTFQQIKQIIKLVLEDDKQKYDFQKVKFLISCLVITKTDKILQMLDKYYTNHQNNHKKLQLIYQLFKSVSAKISVIKMVNNVRSIKSQIFSEFMQLYFIVRNQNLKLLILNSIFYQVRQNLIGQQEYVIEEISKSLNVNQSFNQNVIEIINFYLQNKQINIEQ